MKYCLVIRSEQWVPMPTPLGQVLYAPISSSHLIFTRPYHRFFLRTFWLSYISDTVSSFLKASFSTRFDAWWCFFSLVPKICSIVDRRDDLAVHLVIMEFAIFVLYEFTKRQDRWWNTSGMNVFYHRRLYAELPQRYRDLSTYRSPCEVLVGLLPDWSLRLVAAMKYLFRSIIQLGLPNNNNVNNVWHWDIYIEKCPDIHFASGLGIRLKLRTYNYLVMCVCLRCLRV